MMFVLHEVGSTKKIKKKQWASLVRIVAAYEDVLEEGRWILLCLGVYLWILGVEMIVL
jgi:hypothetical protein